MCQTTQTTDYTKGNASIVFMSPTEPLPLGIGIMVDIQKQFGAQQCDNTKENKFDK